MDALRDLGISSDDGFGEAGERHRALGRAGHSPLHGGPAVNALVTNTPKTHGVTFIVWVGDAVLQFLITEYLQENEFIDKLHF